MLAGMTEQLEGDDRYDGWAELASGLEDTERDWRGG